MTKRTRRKIDAALKAALLRAEGHAVNRKLYLVAVIDWASRAVLAWRLSNTMETSFCVSALEEALARFGRPEIFNTDKRK
jgi:transposase InsO family protein